MTCFLDSLRLHSISSIPVPPIHIKPNRAIKNVERPEGCIPIRFTHDGNQLIAISCDLTGLQVYTFRGSHPSLSPRKTLQSRMKRNSPSNSSPSMKDFQQKGLRRKIDNFGTFADVSFSFHSLQSNMFDSPKFPSPDDYDPYSSVDWDSFFSLELSVSPLATLQQQWSSANDSYNLPPQLQPNHPEILCPETCLITKDNRYLIIAGMTHVKLVQETCSSSSGNPEDTTQSQENVPSVSAQYNFYLFDLRSQNNLSPPPLKDSSSKVPSISLPSKSSKSFYNAPQLIGVWHTTPEEFLITSRNRSMMLFEDSKIPQFCFFSPKYHKLTRLQITQNGFKLDNVVDFSKFKETLIAYQFDKIKGSGKIRGFRSLGRQIQVIRDAWIHRVELVSEYQALVTIGSPVSINHIFNIFSKMSENTSSQQIAARLDHALAQVNPITDGPCLFVAVDLPNSHSSKSLSSNSLLLPGFSKKLESLSIAGSSSSQNPLVEKLCHATFSSSPIASKQSLVSQVLCSNTFKSSLLPNLSCKSRTIIPAAEPISSKLDTSSSSSSSSDSFQTSNQFVPVTISSSLPTASYEPAIDISTNVSSSPIDSSNNSSASSLSSTTSMSQLAEVLSLVEPSENFQFNQDGSASLVFSPSFSDSKSLFSQNETPPAVLCHPIEPFFLEVHPQDGVTINYHYA